MSSHGYGWIPQRRDHRDRLFHLEEHVYQGRQVPAKVDLWDQKLCPPIWDQGQLGSCTAHGSLRAYLTESIRQGEKVPMLSRLMQYWDTRAVEGTTGSDAGGVVRDAVKVLAQDGCCPENDWPYDISKFTDRPSPACYQAAKPYLAIKYQSVLVSGPGAPMRTALAGGLAITFGFSVPESFEDGSWDPASEVLPLPGPSEGFVGGHCVALTGYDFTCKDHPVPYFIADNSWGDSWGWQGRFRLDYRWFSPWEGLASDLWVVQAVK